MWRRIGWSGRRLLCAWECRQVRAVDFASGAAMSVGAIAMGRNGGGESVVFVDVRAPSEQLAHEGAWEGVSDIEKVRRN